MDESDENPGLSTLESRIRQLENTAREAHVHLRDELADEKARRDVQQDDISQLQDDLADARQQIRRLEQQLIALRAEDDE